jgi:hypothetical protein
VFRVTEAFRICRRHANGKTSSPNHEEGSSMKRKSALAILVLAAALAGVASLNADSEGKVDICHIPPGNPANAHTINVSVNAIPAHLAHGDFLGTCEAPPTE